MMKNLGMFGLEKNPYLKISEVVTFAAGYRPNEYMSPFSVYTGNGH